MQGVNGTGEVGDYMNSMICASVTPNVFMFSEAIE